MGESNMVTAAGFYMDGFFGYSAETDFVRYSAAHLIPLFVFVLSVVLLWVFKDRIRNCRNEKRIMQIIGFVLIFVEMSYYWRIMYVGPSWYDDVNLINYLPLQVCEWTCIFAAVMMLTGSHFCFSICYYTCMTLSWFALLIPSVIDYTGPGYYRYYQYWLEHMLPMFTVFYMMFVHGYTVRLKDILKPIVFLFCLVVPSTYLNSVFGTNYMYLVPGGSGDPFGSLFPDTVPLRVVAYTVIALALFAVVWWPVHCNRKQLESFAELSHTGNVSG